MPGSLEAVGQLTDEEIDAVIARTLAQQAEHGVTTVRDLGDRKYRTLAFRDAAAPEVPRIVAAGPPFTTEGGALSLPGRLSGGFRRDPGGMAEHVSTAWT